MTDKKKVWAIKDMILDSNYKTDFEQLVKDIMKVVEKRDYSYLFQHNGVMASDADNKHFGWVSVREAPENRDTIEDDTIITVQGAEEPYQIKAKYLYDGAGLRKRCPKCGRALYVSDVVGYDYVCLHCDENF